MWKQITALWCQCEECGHEWIAKELPKRCAKGKHRAWNSGMGQQPTKSRPASDTRDRKEGGRVEVVQDQPRSIEPSRPLHDTKSCRIYRCGTCAAIGK